MSRTAAQMLKGAQSLVVVGRELPVEVSLFFEKACAFGPDFVTLGLAVTSSESLACAANSVRRSGSGPRPEESGLFSSRRFGLGLPRLYELEEAGQYGPRRAPVRSW